MIRTISFALVISLGACASSHQHCVKRANATLAALDQEIEASEIALIRGYHVEERRRVTAGIAFCTSNRIRACISTERPIQERRLPIDPATERAKLNTLKSRRPTVATQAQRAVQACANLGSK